ncbi:MAG TPA: hypothetical protein DEH11_18205, partial [Actinobacteria bacterium]|nr:hypothetical protein [Actinomycetota bacterium]
LLAALLAHAPVGFAFFGPDLRFLRVNEVLAQFGPDGQAALDPAAHVGRSPAEVWPAALAQRAEAALRQVLGTN